MMRIFNGIKTAGIWITLVIIGIIAFINVFFTLCYVSPYSIRNQYFDFEAALIGIIIAIAILYCLYKLKDKILSCKLKTLIIISMMITLIIGISWVIMSQYTSASDSYRILINALSIPNDWRKVNYLQKFPYQSGVLLYMLLYAYPLHNISTQTIYLIMEYVNIIPVCLTTLMLILLTRELFNEKTAKITAVLTSLFITIPLTVVQVYGNILSLPLTIACILLIVKTANIIKNNHKIKRKTMKTIIINMSVLIMLSFIIGALKLNNVIIGIAMTLGIMIFTVELIAEHHKTKTIIGRTGKIAISVFFIAGILIIPMMMTGEHASIKTVEILRDYPFDENKQQPATVFIGMGMGDESDHGPGFYFYELGNETVNVQKAEKKSRIIIHNRLNQLKEDPTSFIMFFANKIAYTWSEPTYSYATRPAKTLYDIRNNEQNDNSKGQLDDTNWKPVVLNETFGQKIVDSEQLMIILRTFTDGICIIIAIFALIGAYMNRKNIIINMIPAIAIAGGFLFHIFWETQPEYAYTYFLLLIPYAAYGMNNNAIILEKLKRIRQTGGIHKKDSTENETLKNS